jgi:quinoprotein glucose dehydrogenase
MNEATVQHPDFAKRPWVLAVLLLLIGSALALGGAILLAHDGSLYYLLTGVAVLASGVLLLRERREGAWLYALMLVCTIVWALWEVGFDGWQLMPRLAGPAVLGLWFLAPWVRRSLRPGKWALWIEGKPRWALAALPIVAWPLGIALHQTRALPANPIFQRGVTQVSAQPANPSGAELGASDEWQVYGGTKGGLRYSNLADVTPANIGQLKQVWSYRAGVSPQGVARSTLQSVPLVIGNRFYFCTSVNEVVALDATTGKPVWRRNPKVNWEPAGRAACRGVSYYKVADGAAASCPERIIVGTIDARLLAFDARTGEPCPDFGRNGEVSLLEGMGPVDPGYYYVSSPPTIVRGRVVVGGWVADGQYWGEPSGVIRAFDARTGALSWAFDIGRPDRTGLPPEGEHYTRATPNSWAIMSADEELGLVYAPMGNATPDYYGPHRRAFDDRYASGVVAIDAETGRDRWHFQTTHHDVWDYDVASQPTLFDLPDGKGGIRRALIQPTKRAEIFVLDRATGEPIFEVRELGVPQAGAAPGERLSPTQPFSTGMPSFRGRDLIESDMWGITPLDQMLCRIQFRTARYEGPMTPPGLTPWIQYPGYVGGSNWGSISVDPARMIMMINVNHVANRNQLITREEADRLGLKPMSSARHDVGGAVPQARTPFAAKIAPFFSPLLMPCQAPPYGTMSAVDLTSGKLIWTRPLGTSRGTGPLGLAFPFAIAMGSPNMGGSLATRSGLTFIGASTDSGFRAFETTTGKRLWETELPASGVSTPISYRGKDGRQFIAITAAGSAGLGGKAGDQVVAFALPTK